VATNDVGGLKLRFLGALVEQLGAQMYPSATSTIAELISNAWDADANNVWVTIPFGQSWDAGDATISVIDDGVGMTRNQAQERYLIVGRKRRTGIAGDRTDGGRPLHGRKGIGKLAAFGTARILELCTVSDGVAVRFRLDYDSIRKQQAGSDYQVEEAHDKRPLQDPSGTELEHGTRIVLSELRLRRAINADQFRRSMSRRFALDTMQMAIHINGEELQKFDYPVQFRFPNHAVPDGVTVEDGWAAETLTADRQVRWWMGFTEKPLPDQSMLGISVLARGKMVQRPFFFQRAQGVRGQLGQEYLVGEVHADWLDEGSDIDTDRVQANRDQLQLEDDDLNDFLNWGQRRLAWALNKRLELTQNRIIAQFEIDGEIQEMLSGFTKSEKARYTRLAKLIASIEGMDKDGVLQSLKEVIYARDDMTVRQMWENIDQEAPDVQSKIWEIVNQFSLIDARRSYTLIKARIEAISQLKRFVKEGASEVPTIHDHIRKNTWLLDPRWHLLGHEIDVGKLGITYEHEVDSGLRMDYLFALGPREHSVADEIIVVEIKRARKSDGSIFRANVDHLQKFERYAFAAQQFAARQMARQSTGAPTVRALMVAQDYTQDAWEYRTGIEQMAAPRMAFHTWDRVIDDAERLHKDWLKTEHQRMDDSTHASEEQA